MNFAARFNAGPSNTLFFTAGTHDETNGLFGTLASVAAEQHGSEQELVESLYIVVSGTGSGVEWGLRRRLTRTTDY